MISYRAIDAKPCFKKPEAGITRRATSVCDADLRSRFDVEKCDGTGRCTTHLPAAATDDS